MNAKQFLGKKCKLSYHSGFVIDGWVMDIDDAGVTFRSEQTTSFVTWAGIRDVRLDE